MGGRTPIGATTAPNPTDQGIGIAFGDVRKAFGEVVALDGITFEIARHSRIGIVGSERGRQVDAPAADRGIDGSDLRHRERRG